jgi:hypothetical protein
MTADPRLTRSAFVDVVTHVSEIVCLEPGWTLPVPSHPAAARSASRSCRHCTDPKLPECAHPDIVESGL